jgi:hypothetical protein
VREVRSEGFEVGTDSGFKLHCLLIRLNGDTVTPLCLIPTDPQKFHNFLGGTYFLTRVRTPLHCFTRKSAPK